MRKCPRCGETYDDTWKVCLNCSTALSDNLSIKETNPEMRKGRGRESLSLFIKISMLLTGAVGSILMGIIILIMIAAAREDYYYRPKRQKENSKENVSAYLRADRKLFEETK